MPFLFHMASEKQFRRCYRSFFLVSLLHQMLRGKKVEYTVDRNKFKFKHLPQYAEFLLNNKLEEFVTVGIRFCREEDLPMLKPLSKMPESELVKASLDSNRQILTALQNGTIPDFIENNLKNWVNNKLGIIDKTEIAAEDLTLAYYIRRRLFAHFLYSYVQNTVLHQQIIAEVDAYTTHEELITLKVYLEMQKD
ncbi:MAG: hypothetical protein JWO44_2766 [Bacteroidetes bacterium]|nr:hypothetical protein [Bacteroidota bacterium]